MGKYRLHIVYGCVIFVLLVLMVIGFSYCGVYKNKSQKLANSLSDRNAENEKLLNVVNALEKELETTKGQLKAKITEADMLNAALSDLRDRVKGAR